MTRAFSLPAYLGLWAFGLCLGLIEAAVVCYLRLLAVPQLTDMVALQQVYAAMGPQLLRIERVREFATLVILAIPALQFSARPAYKFLAYVVCFGVWDLAYYAFLKLFLDWPPNLMTLDLLFLLPRPWIAPVLCPILVSATMVLVVTAYLVLARSRFLKGPNPFQWAMLVAGAVLVLYAFMAHASAYEAAPPSTPPFDWIWFEVGYGLAVVGALHLLLTYYRQQKTRFF